jgi:hypothetical protein
MSAVDPPAARTAQRGRKPSSSGLSVSDFAACRTLGMRPVGLVQGFCATTLLYWRTPQTGVHTVETDARGTATITHTWGQALASAYKRMGKEATAAGAHGIVGVVDSITRLEGHVLQFHVRGTAVIAEGRPAPTAPWSTFLAGARLGKLMEAGFMPVSTITCRSTATMWTLGSAVSGWRFWRSSAWSLIDSSGAASQLVPEAEPPSRPDPAGLHARLEMAARRNARDHVRTALGPDHLHGGALHTLDEYLGEERRVLFVQSTLRGTRVRRYREAEPSQPPTPTVSLS